MKLLAQKVAVVTGASMGVGRGIASVLGEAGATVYVTGRSVRGALTSTDLPGTTIDETAEMVTARGGVGIPVRCDHLNDSEVHSLFARVQQEQGRLDILVNNAFGDTVQGEPFWLPFWEQPLARWDMMQLVRAHLLASRLAIPLMRRQPQGLIVHTGFVAGEDCGLDKDDQNLYFYLAMATSYRMATIMANELVAHQYPIAVIPLALGWTRTEAVLHEHHTTANKWQHIPVLADTQSPEYSGRAIVALAMDPAVMQRTGKIVNVGDLARLYDFTDIDGRQP